jgi:hypothetical protein
LAVTALEIHGPSFCIATVADTVAGMGSSEEFVIVTLLYATEICTDTVVPRAMDFNSPSHE